MRASSQQRHRLLATLTALLPARDAPLGFGKLRFRRAILPGVLHTRTRRRDEEHLQPHVDARLLAGHGQRFGGHLGPRATDLPPLGLAGDGDRLGRAVEWAMAS